MTTRRTSTTTGTLLPTKRELYNTIKIWTERIARYEAFLLANAGRDNTDTRYYKQMLIKSEMRVATAQAQLQEHLYIKP